MEEEERGRWGRGGSTGGRGGQEEGKEEEEEEGKDDRNLQYSAYKDTPQIAIYRKVESYKVEKLISQTYSSK